jgi:nitrogen fixation/metabolism regulation signal transduction histidine kinase
MIKRPSTSLTSSLLLHEISFVLLILLTVSIASIWSYTWQSSSEEALRLATMSSKIQHIRSELYRQSKEVFDASFLQDLDANEEYQTYTDTIIQHLDELGALATHNDERQVIDLVTLAYEHYYNETIRFFDLQTVEKAQQELLKDELEQQTFIQLETAFQRVEDILNEQQEQLQIKQDKWAHRFSLLIIAPIIAALSLLVFARRYLRKNVVRPLNAVIDAAKIISQGNIDHTVTVKGAQELELLSTTLNSMTNEILSQRETLIETKQQAALAELIPLVAHNIRNPLAGIRAASQVARDETESEDTKETLTDIMIAVDRLEHWVSSLLIFLNPIKPNFSQASAITVLDNVLQIINLQLTDSHIKVERLGWTDDAIRLRIDTYLIEQALLNLIQNAIDASPHGSTIRVQYQETNTQIMITVSDMGSGMRFDPVTETVLDGHTKKQSCGLGIPFAIKVIKQHDGQLVFESNDPKGTRVIITIPTLTS